MLLLPIFAILVIGIKPNLSAPMANSELIVDTAGEEGLRARSGQHLTTNHFGAPDETDNKLKANDIAVGAFGNPRHRDLTEALDLDYEIVDHPTTSKTEIVGHPTTSKTEESKSEVDSETPLETQAVSESDESHFKIDFQDLNLPTQVIVLIITAYVELFKQSHHPLPRFIILYIFVLLPILDHMGL
ncbi:hypothetical protein PGT21_019746 [Puccinia graminis f. sp. tritici]|uniref:Uncharacterized protein n=1 Tax=Puccinia graminis f. sp. tritici TaxID=56615 RepID=A0A5B0LPQ7_PUCGR|nr:hypothetical protein PGT21_019746 [Puccinia graminis f. sp. tritici]KAA1130294.1 hypothetical protein PGTUg99_011691 [Puccinia graminis f. sp. tritici]